jgi:ribonuclease D
MPSLLEEIVTTPEALVECCAHLASQKALGFDTEFVGEDSYVPELCLIQVATEERLYLLDPLTCGPLDAFWNLLLDPERVVVVHAGREEVRMCRLATGAVPPALFDLQLAAGLVGMPYPMGHGPLVGQLVGARLAKGETLTEWRKRPLTPDQVRYAYDDVRYLLPAWRKLNEKLAKRGRLEWAREEFAKLAVAAAPEQPDLERWRKLRSLGSLDRRRLAIVRALYLWREGVAARLNRPPRVIVRDDLIVEIAKRGPTREQDLRVVRGLTYRDLGAILAVVDRARALPPEQWPDAVDREQDPPQVALVTNVMTAVLGDQCVRMKLANSLVASTADVRALVRSRFTGTPLRGECTLSQGWRAAHVLPELVAVLDGKRSLRIIDVRAETPFGYEDRV